MEPGAGGRDLCLGDGHRWQGVDTQAVTFADAAVAAGAAAVRFGSSDSESELIVCGTVLGCSEEAKVKALLGIGKVDEHSQWQKIKLDGEGGRQIYLEILNRGGPKEVN